MDGNNESEGRIWHHTSWKAHEIKALVDAGFIGFIPTPLPGPETIGEERAILPLRRLGNEVVSHLDLTSDKATAFIEKAKERNAIDPKHRRLGERSQLSCFCRWAGIPEPLWHDPTWRECMLLVHGEERSKAIDLLPQDGRKRLDQKANALRRKKSGTSQLDRAVQEAVTETANSSGWGLAILTLAREYLAAKVEGHWNSEHPLNRRLPESGLIQAVCAEWDRDRLPVEQVPPKPSPNEFLHYLDPRMTSEARFLGNISAKLMEIEAATPTLPEKSKLGIPSVYKWLSKSYAAALGLPPTFFQDVATVYHILSIEEVVRERAACHRSVFLAAELVRREHCNAFHAYLDWIRLFQARVVRPYVESDDTGDAHAYWDAMLRPYHLALTGDVLLNCVLHSEVFKGRNWLYTARARGGQARRLEGLTAAYTIKRFKQECPGGRRPKIGTIFSNASGLVQRVAPEKHELDEASVYVYVAPLMNALVRRGGYPFTGDSVRVAYNRYKKDPTLGRFENDLSTEFANTLRWTRRITQLP